MTAGLSPAGGSGRGEMVARLQGGGMNEIATGQDSRALANQIIALARQQGRALTIMQLIKLAYFAHGWSLGLNNRPLSKHPVQAWQHGPVFPHIYRSLTGAGSKPIDDFIREKRTGEPYTGSFAPQDEEVLASVVSGYGEAHAFALSNLTHEPGSPWDVTIRQSGVYSEIPDPLIRDYFRKQAETANGNNAAPR